LTQLESLITTTNTDIIFGKNSSRFKFQKDRITAMVCANASGNHRLPLLVIGKSKKPHAFKNLNMNVLPVNYYAQKSVWMDQTIFFD